MDGDERRYEHDPLSERVIGRTFMVGNCMNLGTLKIQTR